MPNPNEYDDAAYLKASNDLHDAVSGLWYAGATADEIESELQNAKENAGVEE